MPALRIGTIRDNLILGGIAGYYLARDGRATRVEVHSGATLPARAAGSFFVSALRSPGHVQVMFTAVWRRPTCALTFWRRVPRRGRSKLARGRTTGK